MDDEATLRQAYAAGSGLVCPIPIGEPPSLDQLKIGDWVVWISQDQANMATAQVMGVSLESGNCALSPYYVTFTGRVPTNRDGHIVGREGEVYRVGKIEGDTAQSFNPRTGWTR